MAGQILKRIEVEMKDLEALLERAKSSMSRADYELLEKFLASFAYLTELIEDKDTTIARLRKLLFGPKSEKSKDVLKAGAEAEAASGAAGADTAGAKENKESDGKEPSPSASPAGEASDEGEKQQPPGHGRNGAGSYQKAERIDVPHPTLKPGDPCPQPNCKGKVYRLKEPGVLVRVRGLAPLAVLIWALEKLRCNLCGEIFTADPPPEVGEEKYDATAASMIAILKYGTGMPFNRLEKLQKSLGVPLPASTQWEVMKTAAAAASPAYRELVRQAAQGEVLHNDDTPMMILEYAGERRRKAIEKGELAFEERTGVFTSGIVAKAGERKIGLFFTGRKHAGENLAAVLSEREAELGPPIQMSDGLSRNQPGEFSTIMANCLIHARRNFVEVVESFPRECRFVIKCLEAVYEIDARARKLALSPEGRLRLHQEESGLIMEVLQAWMNWKIADHEVEPNSGLGEAMGYMLRRWERLTLFLRTPRAPLDNNLVERALKKAILHRKNALFYRSQNGALVGDIFMSLIYTCQLTGADPFDYLSEIQRHAEELAAKPEGWMPWSYRGTLERSGRGREPGG